MLRELLMNRNNFEDIALIQGGREITYGTLMGQAAALSHRLKGFVNENVALFLPNGGQYISALWGGLMAGTCLLPLNPRMTVYEVEPLLLQADIKAVVTLAEKLPFFERMAARNHCSLLAVEDFTGTDTLPMVAQIDPEYPALLFATSGTTATAKIVPLTENNIMACVKGYLERVSFDRDALGDIRLFAALPFSSAYGMMILTACLIHSIPLVISNRPFSLTELYQAAQAHRVTHYEGGAAAIELMAQTIGRPIGYDISPLKYFGFGGSKVSGGILQNLQNAYPGIELYQGYGMTECAPLLTKHPRGRVEKLDSVGLPIQGVEIAIATQSGLTKDPYLRGEIAAQGGNIMTGYYKNPAETEKVLIDGYLYTGDMGYLDEDGYLYICGRKKNVIIIRGFSVYPEEVEACLHNSRLALDCHVYGELDDRGNEYLCACVVPINCHVTAEQIGQYCQGHLADYKWPRTILLCETIERMPSGKIRRRKGSTEG